MTVAKAITAEWARAQEIAHQARMRRLDLESQGWLNPDQELMLGLLAMLEDERAWITDRPSIFRDPPHEAVAE